jgi:hypothetical protein
MAEQGREEQAIEHTKEGLAAHRMRGVEMLWPYFLTVLVACNSDLGIELGIW